jgi:hypothetical protein
MQNDRVSESAPVDAIDPDELRRVMEETENLLRLQARRRNLVTRISSVALAVAIAGSATAFFEIYIDQKGKDQAAKISDDKIKAIILQLNETEHTAQQLRENVKAYEARLDKAGDSGKPSGGLTTADQQALVRAENGYADLDRRMSSLEAALMQSPDKSIAVPLLRQQMIDMQDKSNRDIENLQGELNRLYGIMQWFLGLMITSILGVGGLVMNSFRQTSERKSQMKEGEKVQKGDHAAI